MEGNKRFRLVTMFLRTTALVVISIEAFVRDPKGELVYPTTRLICLENTHGNGQSTIAFTPLHQDETDEVTGSVQTATRSHGERQPVEVCFAFSDVDAAYKVYIHIFIHGTPAPFRQGNTSAQEAATPNNILFIENLPHETTSMMLELLFQQYPGFREVRIIEAKPGIAFVEFEDDVQSSMAMQELQGFKITPQNPMAITFAKKSSRNFTKTLSNESGKPIECKEEMKECYVVQSGSFVYNCTVIRVLWESCLSGIDNLRFSRRWGSSSWVLLFGVVTSEVAIWKDLLVYLLSGRIYLLSGLGVYLHNPTALVAAVYP
ncbi:hypothetical protein G4B88_010263 [Cannabis sativa]|uniref:RRM domain-containing protein n=1 Tax=Cannabis sativa TaxID=3483 RepID=A0A7J6I6X9_CANSA|nr:hypothetical protein G4B88_010263 [Cannabis sativa]